MTVSMLCSDMTAWGAKWLALFGVLLIDGSGKVLYVCVLLRTCVCVRATCAE